MTYLTHDERASLHIPFLGISSAICWQFVFSWNPTVRMWTRPPHVFVAQIWSQSDHICYIRLTYKHGLHFGGGAITWGNSNVFSFVTILVMPQILESWHICYVDDKWPTPKKLGFLSKFSEAHHPQSWKAAWGHFRRFPLFMEQTTCAQPSPYPDEKIPTRIGHQSERYWLLHFAPTFILFLTKMTQKWTKTITTKMKITKIKF